ncbi:DUF4179 domain-containing protein [Alicyclobacillus curvatus]|jgi:hypothetical protein|nr:DUF4179 domain-containing protein [Alicyclobacillus curvatus]
MEINEENPLLALQSGGLTSEEKEQMWDSILKRAELEKGAEVRKGRKRGRRAVASGVLAVTAVLALVGYTNPQLLEIGKTFNLLKSRMFSTPQVTKAVSLGYGQKVDQSVTSNGITLTIGNVYADSTKLVFDMVESFTSPRLKKPVIQDQDISLNINGTRQLTGFSGGQFQAASDGKYAGIVYLPLMNDQPYRPLPVTFTLNVLVKQIGDVKGDWSFSIHVSQEKLQKNTRVFHPNVLVTNNGYKMKITSVAISPVQTVVQGTMTIPPHGTMPNQMAMIDNLGHRIGGQIVERGGVKQTPSGRIVQMTVTGEAPSQGATRMSMTPLRFYQTPTVTLQGTYPKAFTVFPGLRAHVTGIAFNATDTVVSVSMDQATYKKLAAYAGAGQFFLVAQTATASDSVGAQSVKFDSPISNTARIIFGKVDSSKPWGLEKSYTLPQSQLVAEIPLN